jgi:hypothetical protein
MSAAPLVLLAAGFGGQPRGAPNCRLLIVTLAADLGLSSSQTQLAEHLPQGSTVTHHGPSSVYR